MFVIDIYVYMYIFLAFLSKIAQDIKNVRESRADKVRWLYGCLYLYLHTYLLTCK